MRYWVQFLQMSTGYIPGTVPPQFGAPAPIDACGSDGVMPLDGRLSYENMIRAAKEKAQSMEHFRKFVGFRICVGPRLYEEARRGTVCKLTYPVQV